VAFKVAALYALLGCIWIAFSDFALGSMVKTAALLNRLQTFRGWFFVAMTSFVLYILIGKYIEKTSASSQALRESQRTLATLMSNLPGMAYRCRNDPQWTMEFVSEGSFELTGYQPSDLINNRKVAYADLIVPEDREPVWNQVQQSLESRQPFQLAYRVTAANGKEKWVEEQGRGVVDDHGHLVALEGIVFDKTEGHELERQLLQAQRMEAVGRLAGGVAHDFNNLLMVIKGYAELLLDRMDAESPFRPHAAEIMKAAERSGSVVRQLLAFSRKDVVQPVILNLSALVTGMEAMLRRLISEDVALVTRLDPALSHVKADPGQLEQVIMNLAVNAHDAMPEGGTLTIETANVTLDENYARWHLNVEPGDYVLLALSDTGIGMNAETRSHIFEPFFTTKEKGKGTGLGLSTVYGIVQRNAGTIWVYSEPGQGTTFKIYLPQIKDPVAVGAPPPDDQAAGVTGTETILLAEDEDGVRSLTREFLNGAGYTVLEAATGDLAAELARQHPGPIDLLLTDVIMPGMSGRELAEHLATGRPATRIIYMSGYTDDTIFSRGSLTAGALLLQKPFARDTLLRKIRGVLDAGVLEARAKGPFTPRLLVVEDDRQTLSFLREVLVEKGTDPRCLQSASQAAQLINHEKFDGIFLDWLMPELSGLDLARQVRASKSNSNCPIVMITGNADPAAMRESFAAGVSFFLLKPVGPEQIERLLRATRAMMLQEHLRYQRVPFQAPVLCRWTQGSRRHNLEGTGVNLSVTGMLARFEKAPPPGKVVDIKFSLPDDSQPLFQQADVVRSTPDRFVGLRFLNQDREQHWRLLAFIDRCAGSAAEERDHPQGASPHVTAERS